MGDPTAPAVLPTTPPSVNEVETGARMRVVNLYQEEGQPVGIDVYSQIWSAGDFGTVEVLKATVPYGQASDWFDPGRANAADEALSVVTNLYRQGDRSRPIAGNASTDFKPGDSTTMIVASDVFVDQPAGSVMLFFHDLREYHVEDLDTTKALLLVSAWGLPDSDDYLFASVGDGCLPNALSDDTEFQVGQPVGPGSISFAPMALEPGSHQLTFHGEDAELVLPECNDDPLFPALPIEVAAGQHYLLFVSSPEGDGTPQMLFLAVED